MSTNWTDITTTDATAIAMGNDDETKEARKFHGYLATIIALLGVVINAVTIVTIRKSKNYKDIKKDLIFVLNLLVVNFLSSVLVLGAMAGSAQSKSAQPNTIHCKSLRYMEFICKGSEYFALLLISANRYLMIVHPNVHRKLFFKDRNIVLVIILSNCICPLLFIPQMLDDWRNPKYNVYTSTCIHEGTRNLDFIITMVMFVLLMPLLAFFYLALLYKVCTVRKRVRDVIGSAYDAKNRKQDNRLAMIVVVILTKMAVTYLPYFILSIVNPRGSSMLDNRRYNIYLHMTLLYLNYTNNFTNAVFFLLTHYGLRRTCHIYCSKLCVSRSFKTELVVYDTKTSNRSENGREKTGANTDADKRHVSCCLTTESLCNSAVDDPNGAKIQTVEPMTVKEVKQVSVNLEQYI